MYEQVGPGTTISRPCRTASARVLALSAIRRLASLTAPPSRYGIPQQRWGGKDTLIPFLSSTPTAALPVAGSLSSTEQVANSATRPRTANGAVFRWSNQLEKVWRWNAGRFLSRWIPRVASMSWRCTGSAAIQLERGAARRSEEHTSELQSHHDLV